MKSLPRGKQHGGGKKEKGGTLGIPCTTLDSRVFLFVLSIRTRIVGHGTLWLHETFRPKLANYRTRTPSLRSQRGEEKL